MADAYWVIRTAGAAFPRVPFWEAPERDFRRDVADAFAAHNSAPAWLPGMIIKVGWDNVKPGWLFCDGTALRRVDYPALFDFIGTRFGAGDGATTFNLPTQAQCDAVVVEPTPPQVVTGGSVEPVAPPATPPTEVGSGSGGGNVVTGGRPSRGPDVPENVDER